MWERKLASRQTRRQPPLPCNYNAKNSNSVVGRIFLRGIAVIRSAIFFITAIALMMCPLGSQARKQSHPRTAPGPCGQLEVTASANAIAPAQGPKPASFDQTYPLPNGAGPGGQVINVSWGIPRYGAYSNEAFSSSCSVNADGSAELQVSTTTNIGSGVGAGAGASGGIGTGWFLVRSLPSTNPAKPWHVSLMGTIGSQNANPSCSIQVNDQKMDISPGPVMLFFDGLPRQVGVIFSCNQASLSIFPHGPDATYDTLTVNYDVTLNFYQ